MFVKKNLISLYGPNGERCLVLPQNTLWFIFEPPIQIPEYVSSLSKIFSSLSSKLSIKFWISVLNIVISRLTLAPLNSSHPGDQNDVWHCYVCFKFGWFLMFELSHELKDLFSDSSRSGNKSDSSKLSVEELGFNNTFLLFCTWFWFWKCVFSFNLSFDWS